VLELIDVHRARESIVATCAIDDLRFHVTVWYEDVDLHELAREHGDELVERLCVHVALFQLNTAASLRPDAIALGRYARHLTAELQALWSTIFRRVWAQWRWEHQLPDYHGPKFVDPVQPSVRAVTMKPGPTELLAFCGGGKDSLVSLRLLERAGLPFATLGYSHSIYGPAEPQHALLERVAGGVARARAERQWIFDDVLDSPVAKLRPSLGVSSLLAAETPASVFAALPLALARGYRGLVVGHEHSANTGNLVWDATGEEVNHQWGKGWEAEQLLDRYVGAHMLEGVRYFSVLQPISDEVIFELLARDAELAPRTHSCNVQKPWCRACAKCAYVWLQFAAHLPTEVVHATFGESLIERADNARWFDELLGLAEHSPFECVGSPPEARLALELARRRGVTGPRLDAYATRVGAIDVAALARPYVAVHEQHGMPEHVAARVMPQLREAAARAAKRLGV
jgi:UDP-N-acetyl-alpha-D-muramoyl-L-alanyl-L-glutamate epimerase